MQRKIKEPFDILLELGITSANSIQEYYPYTRDRDDIQVYRCNKSGVIFLSTATHMKPIHYKTKKNFIYGNMDTRLEAINNSDADIKRRALKLLPMIINKNWLDVGTGHGGILDALSQYSKTTLAVEPQKKAYEALKRMKYKVVDCIDKVPKNKFNIITLLHVLEHLVDPIEQLKQLNTKLVNDGIIFIEVPHANDILLSLMDFEPFKKFSLWSEHLILHTRESLFKFLDAAGFKRIIIEGVQRYPLSNHLYWLRNNEKGGHIVWSFLNDTELDKSYAAVLARLNLTDTLIAIAYK